jgi:predicted dehydrogenase
LLRYEKRPAGNGFPEVSYGRILKDKSIDAVVIATPSGLHYELARAALERGMDVLVEKPMTLETKQAGALVKLARRKKRILMVDHIFLFNEAVRKIKELADRGELGDILYIDSTRANLGLFQKDSNVIFDLAVHDFSIVQYLLNVRPESVRAFGRRHFTAQEEVGYINVNYGKKVFAHFHVSWLSPVKIRRLIIVGTRKMLVYDDTEPAEKIRVYEKGVITSKIPEEIKISYRTGDVWLPNVLNKEALATLAGEFIEALTTRKSPLSDGKFGAEVVRLLEKSTLSVRTGKKISL